MLNSSRTQQPICIYFYNSITNLYLFFKCTLFTKRGKKVHSLVKKIHLFYTIWIPVHVLQKTTFPLPSLTINIPGCERFELPSYGFGIRYYTKLNQHPFHSICLLTKFLFHSFHHFRYITKHQTT